MKENNPIDNYFRNSLEGHEVKASPEVWEKVVAGTEAGASRGAIWYLMRAAVVVLMFSFGTWYMFDGPVDQPGVVVSPETGQEENTANKTNQNTEPGAKTNTPAQSEEPSRQEEDEQKQKKVMPIMKNSQSRSPIYVSNEPMMEVDERALYEMDERALSTIELDPAQLAAYGRTSPSMKLKLRQPVSGTAFGEVEPEAAEGNEDLKKKVYAYASHQFNNIRNGKPLELPKTGKPQLQINLNRIFNN